jgi:hypothetical protein
MYILYQPVGEKLMCKGEKDWAGSATVHMAIILEFGGLDE